MTRLVFFLEERSAEAMLEGLLPRILPEGVEFRCIPFEGKQDLEKRLGRQIRVNSRGGARCVVLRDQDCADCAVVKKRLLNIVESVGEEAVVCIACRELESWYLADLEAVERGLGLRNLAKQQAKKKFRTPDTLGSPSRELKELTKGEYQKIAGSRAIGVELDIENGRSPSFAYFVRRVRGLLN